MIPVTGLGRSDFIKTALKLHFSSLVKHIFISCIDLGK